MSGVLGYPSQETVAVEDLPKMPGGPGGMPWVAFGRRHAERKARRKLAAHLCARRREKEQIIVRADR